MNDETYVYLCTLLNDRISDLRMTLENNPDYAPAEAELEIALIALEELG